MKRRTFQVFSLVVDIAILAVSFLFFVWLKPASLSHYLPTHLNFFLVLASFWLIVSFLGGKLHRGKIVNLKSLFSRTIACNIVSLAIAIFLLYVLNKSGYSRMIVLGTAGVATVLELIFGVGFLAVQKATLQDYQPLKDYDIIRQLTEQEMVGEIETGELHEEVINEVSDELIAALKKECGEEAANGILNIALSKLNGRARIVSTTTSFNIASLPEKDYSYIINLQKINNIKNLNHFLDTVNSKIRTGGYYMCCVETKNLRKKRILKKFPPGINYIFYTLDFIVKRVFPKLRITRWLYLILTRDNNIVLSRAEALGRLSRAGFEIVNESFIHNNLFVEARKIRVPLDVNGKYYGILIALPRIGRHGDLIKVYKMRTMHPYSEYIQDYVYSLHDLREGGKFKNDFRITTWGVLSRKIWLDELPMLINLFRGDMKLVGVRPLSKQYYSLYSKELQERRIKFKPGLVPPYYYDMPADLKEIEASEMRYLEAFGKHPFLTDFRYFFVSFFNIIFRRARSS
ncbi:MAG TPA: sugar transferase [Bacteroidales bacterium]|nr:sugar transferase [Bacteroidales bacterium]